MPDLTFEQQITRLKNNEINFDKFLNDLGTYIASDSTAVETLRSFIARKNIELNGLLPAAAGINADDSNGGVDWTTVQGFIDKILSSLGSASVGYDDGTLQDIADYAKPLADITAIRAYAGSAKAIKLITVYATAQPNIFVRDESDTTSIDDGVDIFVDALDRRWKRIFLGGYFAEWGGVSTTNADNSSQFNSVLSAIKTAGGGRLFASAKTYSVTSPVLVAGEYSKGLAIDAGGAQITYTGAIAGFTLGQYSTPAVGYYLKTKVRNLNVSGPGSATVGSASLKIDSTADVEINGGRFRNSETGILLNGGLICDFYGAVSDSNKWGVYAVPANAFNPNLNSFYSARLRSNTIAAYYNSNPNGSVNWIGCDIEGNNPSGNATDGVKVFELSNAGTHNLIGCHFEANAGQYGIDYTGSASTKNLLVLGSEVIHNADTVLEMRAGRLTVVASRITNGTSSKDVNLETGATAVLINSESRVSGDLSRVVSLKDGRMAFGGNANLGQAPIYVAPVALYSNIWAEISGDAIQQRFNNAAGTRIAYMQVGNAIEGSFVSTQAYGWKFASNNVSIFNIGRAGALSIEPATDNAITCGSAALRFSTVYAATGTINTSDERSKQQIRTLTDAEHAVAVKCKGLLRAFKFNESVEEKGNKARWHFGVVAQDVKAAFESEGLNADDFGLFCHDVWDDVYEDVPAEFEQIGVDEDGNPITVEKTPATKKLVKAAGDRYGIRYEELLAFILSVI